MSIPKSIGLGFGILTGLIALVVVLGSLFGEPNLTEVQLQATAMTQEKTAPQATATAISHPAETPGSELATCQTSIDPVGPARWTLDEAPPIMPRESVTFTAAHANLEGGIDAWINLSANVDYAANSECDGSGDVLTGELAVREFDKNRDSMQIEIKNNAEVPAYLTLLQARGAYLHGWTPEPTPEFEIVSVQTEVTEQNDVYWRYAWRLTVENNRADRPLEFNAELQWLNAGGFVVDDDWAFGLSVPAGEEVTFTGFGLIPTASTPDVDSITATLWSR